MYEGAPDWPDKDRLWAIAEKYKATILYTAPTAIRAFMKWGTEFPEAHDLSSLRLLGTVGEPINPEAWVWYHTFIGGGRCPIVDTWWQTETGHDHDHSPARHHDAEAGLGDASRSRASTADVVDDQGELGAARRRRLRRARRVRGRRCSGRSGATTSGTRRRTGRRFAGQVLPRRRLQARRGGLLLVPRTRRRRDERRRTPHLDVRGGVGARRPSVGRGIRRRRPRRRGQGREHRRVRDGEVERSTGDEALLG